MTGTDVWLNPGNADSRANPALTMTTSFAGSFHRHERLAHPRGLTAAIRECRKTPENALFPTWGRRGRWFESSRPTTFFA
jgi:hypothetical protein